MAAGHRPCSYCCRENLTRLKATWVKGNRMDGGTINVDAIDRVLHKERVEKDGSKRKHSAMLGAVKDGAMVELDEPGQAWLVWHGHLLRWTPAGYTERRPVRTGTRVLLLTPPSTVRTIAAGYDVSVHPSGESNS